MEPAHPDTTRTREPRGLIPVLAAVTAVAPLATDMYVPGFPRIASDLGTSGAAVQLSLTGFLVGLAVGQIVLGPLSDRVGRRPVLLGGAIAFTLLSLACAAAPSIVVLDAARVLQGIAGAAGLVVARAVVTDRFAGVAAARRFSTLSVIVFVAPVVAPLAGALVLALGSWRAVFGVLAAFGALLVAGVWAWVPESLPATDRSRGGLRKTVAAMAGLLRDRLLVGHLLALAFGGAALFGYIAGSAFVFQGVYGMSPTAYGLVFASNAVGMLLAGAAFGRLAGSRPVPVLLASGAAVALASATVLVALLLAGLDTPGGTWACLFGTTAGLGMMLPAAVTTVQERGRSAPGATSGILGGAQFVLGAAAAPLPGLLGVTTAFPTAAVVLGALLLAVAALAGLARPWARTAHRG
ncbi:multidrug effflux MFS transporter [Pseudonocardia kunmingensis]|uniref:DHA1 family bicyclomycin/chloramphenicol resistance-like MFS transporter n=1 Tax=Pseudonocardia kunmingensis TaxID=630975 RepID=A0A543E0L6_9PSEU|nr:multidrug effflux MFS transporter [Pseudonocardia kunmingensis]TQM15143.1 DHA1 family bicyclomycin/chloramphenicol resistance-like MFS transporter [Pseudonocardia kunmingensis]